LAEVTGFLAFNAGAVWQCFGGACAARYGLKEQTMPRYFFNITQGELPRPADEGMQLPNDEAAWKKQPRPAVK
jgi:hypothetical protein